jgi:hypothetical protein
MERDLIEKLSVAATRVNFSQFMRDFDKHNLRSIRPDEAVRALSAAGVNLTKAEQEAVTAAYTNEQGMFEYDVLFGDGESTALRPSLVWVGKCRQTRLSRGTAQLLEGPRVFLTLPPTSTLPNSPPCSEQCEAHWLL